MTRVKFCLPLLLIFNFCLLSASMGAESTKQSAPDELVLFDFTGSDKGGDWLIINDGVMGGLSRGEFFYTDRSTAVFQGTVSLENNGGFSSARTMINAGDLAGYSGISLRIKGDGKKYQLRIRTNRRFDGASYQYQFATQADSWIEVKVPFREFLPVYRGRVLNNVKSISPVEIQQIGFLVSDYQAGVFQLEIEWIKAYRE